MKKSTLPILFSMFLILTVFLSFSFQLTQKGIAPTTVNDFFLPGSQPLESGTFSDPDQCDNCHGGYDLAVEPAFNWRGSMMAHAQRDPLYLACLAIANQDAPESGDLCIRCHSPKGWLEGRSLPADGTALNLTDRESVQCHTCHRMIKPTYLGNNPYPGNSLYISGPGNNPSTFTLDQDYISVMTNPTDISANGMYICDNIDNRRGPYYDPQANHDTPYSPFHTESALCGTCHDVSNPVLSAVRDANGHILKYEPNSFDAPAPDFDLYEMFPIERTYSEWKVSEYNTPGGVTGTYFGGNKAFVSSCQDCHMKDVTGKGCNKNYAPVRNDLPLHDMTGGNTFIPSILEQMWPDEVNSVALNDGILRARDMLQHAATMELTVDQLNQTLVVKVTNETGHKLPSGYPEGRRMWLNVKAYNSITSDFFESGYYDAASGSLNKTGAKIYEIKPGLSPGLAAALNLTAGVSFHFVLNDSIYFDNRIPPRGFTNAAFDSIQSPPVGYTYQDGQYWDETNYNLPFIPDSIDVSLYYQTTSKEYVEFLRDENFTNTAGQDFYNLWDQNGKSAPELMANATWSGEPVQTDFELDVTVMLEGAYSGGAMTTNLNNANNIPLIQPFNTYPWNYNGSEVVPGIPENDIVDWVLLELRETPGDSSTATPATTIERKAVFINSQGQLVDLDGQSLPVFDFTPTQNLFVVIRHRNHIPVMSAEAVVRNNGIYTYNFAIEAESAYGGPSAHKEIAPGIWGMVAADGIPDGSINSDDLQLNWKLEAGLTGYLLGDFNLDNQVNNVDKNEVWQNNEGYSSQVPE